VKLSSSETRLSSIHKKDVSKMCRHCPNCGSDLVQFKVGDIVNDEADSTGMRKEKIIAISEGLGWLNTLQGDFGHRIRALHFLRLIEKVE